MLSRTTNGVGPVRRRTFEQLRTLDAGKWFSPDFAGARIPSFREALAHVRGRVGRVYAEVKGYRELEDVDRMVAIARDANMLDSVVFISLSWAALDRIRSKDPSLAVGYIAERPAEAGAALDKARGDARALVDLEAGLLASDPSLVERARGAATELCVWTVDDPGQAGTLLAAGVRRFTTNEVQRLVDWKQAS